MSFFRPKGESDIHSQLKKVIDQLSFLEKKIDSLLDQSRRNRFGGGGNRYFNQGQTQGQNNNFRNDPNRGQGPRRGPAPRRFDSRRDNRQGGGQRGFSQNQPPAVPQPQPPAPEPPAPDEPI